MRDKINFILTGLILMMLLASSCASIKKIKSKTSQEQLNVDKSISKTENNKETNIKETVSEPVYTKTDSVNFKSWLSIADTSGYSQEIETNGQKVKTTVKPRKDNKGNTTGYDINTESIKKSEKLLAPVNKTTTIKETNTKEDKLDKKTSSKSNTTTLDKKVVKFNFAGVLAVVGGLIMFFVFIYFVIRNRITRKIK